LKLPDITPDLGWIARLPIAHRGLHDRKAGRLENTRAAFQAAIDHGFAIECDVQLSADGEAVVFHDDTLDRLAGRAERLQDLDADALRAIQLQGTNDKIEPLSALLTQIGGKVPLVIEVKSRFDGNLMLLRRVKALVLTYSGPFVIKSFDPDVVVALKDEAPHLPRGIVSMSSFEDDADIRHLPKRTVTAMEQLLHFDQSRPHFVSWQASDLPVAAPYFARLMGCPLMGWTVRSSAAEKHVRPLLDQIIFEGFLPGRDA
jgi:glycerophosphoryl diester phosphodiesterase